MKDYTHLLIGIKWLAQHGGDNLPTCSVVESGKGASYQTDPPGYASSHFLMNIPWVNRITQIGFLSRLVTD